MNGNDHRGSDEPEQRFRLVVEAAPNVIGMVCHASEIAVANAQADSKFDFDQGDHIAGMVGEVTLDHNRHIPGMLETGVERETVTNPHGPVVAVVDDDAAVCESTRSLLEAFGFEVSTYSSGADFIREDPEVACLIVDHWMPGLNGLEFVSELKARGRQVPTIMITATVGPAVERRAAELGIKHVLHKPPPAGALLRAIREELSRSAWPATMRD
jgi:CheY-like chemotaxis protein